MTNRAVQSGSHSRGADLYETPTCPHCRGDAKTGIRETFSRMLDAISDDDDGAPCRDLN